MWQALLDPRVQILATIAAGVELGRIKPSRLAKTILEESAEALDDDRDVVVSDRPEADTDVDVFGDGVEHLVLTLLRHDVDLDPDALRRALTTTMSKRWLDELCDDILEDVVTDELGLCPATASKLLDTRPL